MTFFQMLAALVGVGLLIGGIRVLKRSRFIGAISLLAGIWLVNNVLYGEISKSSIKQKQISELRIEEVDKIRILPSKRRKTITEDTILITSNSEITAIQHCLSRTKETLKTNRDADWACILEIQKKDNELILAGVSRKGEQTILELYSKGEYGINYGTMINNQLGELIEQKIGKRK